MALIIVELIMIVEVISAVDEVSLDLILIALLAASPNIPPLTFPVLEGF